MKSERRDFLKTATWISGAALSGAWNASSRRVVAQTLSASGLVDGETNPNAVADPDGEIGEPYRGWREGELDLNFIHTGVGESCFAIYPDGTTALTDAGDRNAAAYKDGVPIVPNESRRPGEWIARHIGRAKPGIKTIDYVVASHFHDDHIGNGTDGAGLTQGRGDDYQLSGIAHVGEFYHFGKAFDRGYPNYDRPTPNAPAERENLRKFFAYKERTDGLIREKFEVGALDQIALKNAPKKYDFHIRNLCANGVLWTGSGAETVDYFERYPKNKEAFTENVVSIGTVLKFGPFKFYSGGDVSGVLRDETGADLDFEGAVGRVAGPVDVCKSNHHSYKDAMRPTFVKAVQARVYVTCVWDRWHLQDNTATAMSDETLYPGPRLICPTTIHSGNAELMQGKSWRKNLVELGGTIVVKAFDGGKKYKVYYLSANDESGRVLAVFGPFDSKGAPFA